MFFENFFKIFLKNIAKIFTFPVVSNRGVKIPGSDKGKREVEA